MERGCTPYSESGIKRFIFLRINTKLISKLYSLSLIINYSEIEMTIKKIYLDSSITGEGCLRPFKMSVNAFGYSFTPWSSQERTCGAKILGSLKRVVCLVIALFGMVVTSPLLPMGMLIKSINQPKQSPITPPPGTLPEDVIETPTNSVVTTPATPTTSNPSDSSKGVPTSTSPLIAPTEVIEQVQAYPGDLTTEQQSHFSARFLNSNTLQLDFKQYPSFKVTIRNQDIFGSGAAVIVNAANTHLGGGGGIDGLIHNKGGSSYAAAHRALQARYQSRYVQGYAAMIGSGNLESQSGIKRVIVVAGPAGDSTEQKEKELYSCYYNSLVLAHNHQYASLAFPAISTGIFGFPKDRAASISKRAICNFIEQFPDSPLKTISIHFLTSAELQNYNS